MSYHVEVDSERRVVHVKVTGRVDFEEALAGQVSAADFCSQNNINRLLVDLRQGEWILGLEDALDFAMKLAAVSFPKGVRFAVLFRDGDSLPRLVARTVSLAGLDVVIVADEQEAFAALAG